MRFGARVLLAVLFVSSTVYAQHLATPQASPHARVEQTFGITGVAIDYHRPAVNGRVIWGGLVPYDVVWRAGANQPTLVSFSTPVKVEGQPLAAGTYSFYYVPGKQSWSAVFNRFTGGWGTYNYDQAEDALRVSVTPQTAEMQERLVYSIDDATDDAATLNMRWEKLRVPLRITADTPALVAAAMKDRLRSELYWDPMAWTEAAMYLFRAGDADTALQYVDHAISLMPTAQSLRIRSRILEKKGDAAGAKLAMERAGAMISPEMSARSSAYALIGQKKYDEAAAAAAKMVEADPKSWRANVTMGDVYASRGDRAKAQEWYAKAMAVAPGQAERVEVQDSINAMMAESVGK